jgi:peptidoglycan hydrolase CwlO-like protein
LKAAQADKQARQAQLEPLQQEAEGIIEKLQEEKGKIEKTHVE